MADRRTAARALQDIRKMRRAVRLREYEDPQEVSEILRAVLREAIAAREAGGETFGKGAMNELRNIRSDLVAGQINAGGRTGEYIGKYSMVLDQMEGLDQEKKRTQQKTPKTKSGGGGLGGIGNMMPSTEAITSAMITANPIMGYSAKMAMDFVKGKKAANDDGEDQVKSRLEELKRTQSLVEDEKQDVEKQKEEDPNPELSHKSDILAERLDVIKDEIHSLNEYLKTAFSDKLDRINDGALHDIKESSEGTADQLERLNEQTEDASRLERDNQARQSMLDREAQYEQRNGGSGTIGAVVDSAADEGGMDLGGLGMMSGIGGAIGGLVSKIFTPILGLLGVMKKGATMIGRLGRLTGVLAIFTSIYSFFDGLFNAADILGKDNSEITLRERLQTAVGHVISGLLEPVDWILDFFDMGFMDDRNGMTRKIGDGLNKVVDLLMDPVGTVGMLYDKGAQFFQGIDYGSMWQSVKDGASSMVDMWKEFVLSPSNTINSFLNKGIDSVIGFLPERFQGEFADKLKWGVNKAISILYAPFDAISAFLQKGYAAVTGFNLEETIENLKESAGSIIQNSVDSVKETISNVFDSITDKINEIRDGITDWVDNKMNWVGDKLSWIPGVGNDDSNDAEDRRFAEAIERNAQQGNFAPLPSTSERVSEMLREGERQQDISVNNINYSPITNNQSTTITGQGGQIAPQTSANADASWRRFEGRSGFVW